jgi:hypothetical protein
MEYLKEYNEFVNEELDFSEVKEKIKDFLYKLTPNKLIILKNGLEKILRSRHKQYLRNKNTKELLGKFRRTTIWVLSSCMTLELAIMVFGIIQDLHSSIGIGGAWALILFLQLYNLLTRDNTLLIDVSVETDTKWRMKPYNELNLNDVVKINGKKDGKKFNNDEGVIKGYLREMILIKFLNRNDLHGGTENTETCYWFVTRDMITSETIEEKRRRMEESKLKHQNVDPYGEEDWES